MPIPKLDALDIKLLSELDRSARQTTSQLARLLKEGRDRVEYRIKRLLEEGAINKFSCLINPHKLGGSIYKIYLKVFSEEEKKKKLLLALSKHPRVFWIAECDGRWNLMFSLVASSPVDFSLKYDQLLSPHQGIVREFDVYPLTQANFFSRGYLASSAKLSWPIGGEIENTALDAIENKIIEELNNNSRISLIELSQRADSSVEIVRHRIDQLQERKIIICYRADLNLEYLSRTRFKAQVFVDGYDNKQKDRLFKYCSSHPEIVYLVEQVGSSSMEIEIETGAYYAYYAIIDKLQIEFPKYIRAIETVLMRNEVLKWVNSIF